MAKLIVRRNVYYARVRWYHNNRQIEKQIPLKTSNEKVALTRLTEVRDLEKYIRNGNDFDWWWLKHTTNKTKLKRLNLSDIINRWLDIRKIEVKENHFKRNIISMQRLIDVLGESFPVDTISLKDIEKFKKYYSNKHLPSGININLRAIKTFLNWCFDIGYISKKPKIKMMNEPRQLPRYINEADFNRIMGLDINIHWKNAFNLYRSTGCRKNEVFDGVINGNWLIIKADDSKTNIEKNIKLNSVQVGIIKEMQSNLSKHIDKGYERYTFIDRYTKVFVNCCKKIGIYERGINLHSLRHTYAVMRYLETGDIYKVKNELGHTSVVTTEKYAQISIKRLEEDFPSIISSKSQARDTELRDTLGSDTYDSRLLMN